MTAGHEGFLSVLPIYLHHILYPTLSDAAYLTEVHHVNGKGKNAGVVYCEMQDTQSKPHSMIHFELCQQIYPGKCGYKSNTGGRLDEIRNSCSNVKVGTFNIIIQCYNLYHICGQQNPIGCPRFGTTFICLFIKVRAYHKKYYIPSNLYVIVCGTIPRDALLEVLFKFEDSILAKGPLPSPIVPPPWSSPVALLEESKDIRIEFGTDDESTGMAKIGYMTCEGNNLYQVLALDILGNSSPVVPKR